MAGQNGGIGWGWPAESGGEVAQAHSNLGNVGFLWQSYPGISVLAQVLGESGRRLLSE